MQIKLPPRYPDRPYKHFHTTRARSTRMPATVLSDVRGPLEPPTFLLTRGPVVSFSVLTCRLRLVGALDCCTTIGVAIIQMRRPMSTKTSVEISELATGRGSKERTCIQWDRMRFRGLSLPMLSEQTTRSRSVPAPMVLYWNLTGPSCYGCRRRSCARPRVGCVCVQGYYWTRLKTTRLTTSG